MNDTRPWDQNSAFWDEQMGDAGNEFHLQLIRPAAERLLGEVAGCRVLDVACGNGSVARRRAELGARVTAIDVSRGMLEHARRRGTAETASIDYRECDATDTDALLALGEAAFDAVVCNMALMDMSQITPLASALPGSWRPAGVSSSRSRTRASTGSGPASSANPSTRPVRKFRGRGSSSATT